MQSHFLSLPELKQLFHAARRYIDGESSVGELNGLVIETKRLGRVTGVSVETLQLLDEWYVRVNRRWNEWGLKENPLSEEEFVRWLKLQLVFDF